MEYSQEKAPAITSDEGIRGTAENLADFAPAVKAQRAKRPAVSSHTRRAAAVKEQVPLFNHEAERKVIGAVLVSYPDDALPLLEKLAQTLGAADFHDSRHGAIWEAIHAIVADGETVNELSLCDRLNARGELTTAGGPNYICELTRCVETTAHVETHAANVAKFALQRRNFIAAKEITQVMRNPMSNTEDVMRAIAPHLAKLESGGRQKTAPRKRLPTIVFSGEGASLTESSTELFGILTREHRVFNRCGHVVLLSAGQLVDLKHGFLPSIAESVCVPSAFKKGNNGDIYIGPSIMSKADAEKLMGPHLTEGVLLPISTVNAQPILVNKGVGVSVLGKGYHAHGGGVLITHGLAVPPVPVAQAVAALAEVVSDFDFETPSDRSRAIASLIAPALKSGGFLHDWLTPIDFALANEKGAGKSYRQHVTAAIYGESMKTVTKKENGVGAGLDDAVNHGLLSGKTHILIDNVRGKIDSPILEAATTSYGDMDARGLRENRSVDPRPINWYITSNGAELTDDAATRVSIIAIRSRPGYQWRVFPGNRDLLEHVRHCQPYYLGCVHAIIREWDRQGRPMGNQVHRFRKWAGISDWMVRTLFNSAPLMDGNKASAEAAANPRLVFLRKLALRIVASAEAAGQLDLNGETDNFTASDLVEFVADEVSADLQIPGVVKGSREAPEVTLGKLMGKVLGKKPEKAQDDAPFNLSGVSIIRRTVWGESSTTVALYRFKAR